MLEGGLGDGPRAALLSGVRLEVPGLGAFPAGSLEGLLPILCCGVAAETEDSAGDRRTEQVRMSC